jgi:hypothetical protein
MNTVRNVSFAALAAVVLSVGSACGIDAGSILNNAKGSAATAPLGFAVAGSVLKRTSYTKLADRFTKAGIVSGVYAATAGNEGTYKGAAAAALIDIALHEVVECGVNTQAGRIIAGYLPKCATSDVAQEVVCCLAAVAVGRQVEQLVAPKL